MGDVPWGLCSCQWRRYQALWIQSALHKVGLETRLPTMDHTHTFTKMSVRGGSRRCGYEANADACGRGAVGVEVELWRESSRAPCHVSVFHCWAKKTSLGAFWIPFSVVELNGNWLSRRRIQSYANHCNRLTTEKWNNICYMSRQFTEFSD